MESWYFNRKLKSGGEKPRSAARVNRFISALSPAFILSMKYGEHYKAGKFNFTQNKTKEIMSFSATERLKKRLTGKSGYLVPFKDGKYDRMGFLGYYTRLRGYAGLDHCKYQTLRHTAIVRLARAGCTHSEIAAISGHSEASVGGILRRYLPRDSMVANNAILKLEKRATK